MWFNVAAMFTIEFYFTKCYYYYFNSANNSVIMINIVFTST